MSRDGDFTYCVGTDCRWVPISCDWPHSKVTSNSRKIESFAVELGTELFCGEVWKEDGDAQIVVEASLGGEDNLFKVS